MAVGTVLRLPRAMHACRRAQVAVIGFTEPFTINGVQAKGGAPLDEGTEVMTGPGSFVCCRAVDRGTIALPSDPLLTAHPVNSYAHVPAADVIKGRVVPESLAGKTMLVGAAVWGLLSLR